MFGFRFSANIFNIFNRTELRWSMELLAIPNFGRATVRSTVLVCVICTGGLRLNF